MTRGIMMNGSSESPAITVYSQSEQVGTLVFAEPGECTFTYHHDWINDRFPISPHIPFEGSVDSGSITRFLRNLFPEGDAFDLLLESQNVSKNNLYAILKTIGMDTAGVLSFFESGYQTEKTKLRIISEQELSSKLASGSTAELITWDGKYRLSVAGIQNKLNVYMDEQKQMFLADGAFSSTHILKFASQAHQTIVINELFCMRLASTLSSLPKMKIANVSFKKTGEHDTLIVERFDRKFASDHVKKRHIIDGCQALDAPPEYKYEQNFGAGRDVKHIREGASLKKLFDFANTCAIPADVIWQLLDWLIFNIIIGNSDAHGKNVSFFVTPDGITIAPFYDLVSVVFEASENEMIDTSLAMAIGDNFDINSITAFDLLIFAENAEVSFSLLKRRIGLLANDVIDTLETLQFNDCEFNELQINTITRLKRLVNQRANNLLIQAGEMDKVSLLI